jgi:cob(I)alamin adenosyltransferase
MAVYTKRGDKGETSLFTKGMRVSKDSLRISAIGAVDELNSFLGVVRSFSEDRGLDRKLKAIQSDLLTVGSILGGSELKFYKSKTEKLERKIDELEKKLPKLTNFIIPGGAKTASLLHFARTLARKAEREVVALSRIETVKPQILVYLNRLSDYLFMIARNQNFNSEIEDDLWKQ